MKGKYLPRNCESSVLLGLKRNPVVALIGPRQCGKSTLARKLIESHPNALYLDLERPSDLAKLSDPELFLESKKDKLVCLDEIQRKPDLFPVLRSLCDDWGGMGHFLILGSASRDLLLQSAETLAGRIRYETLTPFLFDELRDSDWETYLLRGGFPRANLAESDAACFDWLESFIQTFLERDLSFWREFVPETMRRLWRMLAHNNAQIVNYSRLASSLGVSDATIKRYIDLLKETFMLDVVPPYLNNLGKRLVKSPKVYICDTGIACSLLGLSSFDDAFSHPCFGSLWEQMVLSNLRGNFPHADIAFYRTSSGVEMDFIIKNKNKTIAVECKVSSSPVVQRGTYSALDALKPDAAYVVAPVKEAYPLKEKLWVIPLKDLKSIFDMS